MKVLKNFNEKNQYLIYGRSDDAKQERYIFQSYNTIMLSIDICYNKDYTQTCILISFDSYESNYTTTTTKYLKECIYHMIENLPNGKQYNAIRSYLLTVIDTKNFKQEVVGKCKAIHVNI